MLDKCVCVCMCLKSIVTISIACLVSSNREKRMRQFKKKEEKKNTFFSPFSSRFFLPLNSLFAMEFLFILFFIALCNNQPKWYRISRAIEICEQKYLWMDETFWII